MLRLCSAIVIGLLLAPFAAGQNQPTSDAPVMQYMTQGSQAYLRSDYKKAIDDYSKALEMEKAKPVLGKPLWYVLVDNLGISYGITGDLKKAKDTFEYGLTKDAKYPLFYYNLACTYAEMNDMDNAITNLNRGYEFRANTLAGEKYPNPATDDSFKRFMMNDRFLAALREMK